MYIFGLTGGIGSGKSTVSSLLEELGCPIIDADILARKVVEPGRPALKLIVKQFGPDILCSDGQLDRPKLAKIIFEDESKRRVLNTCTHPYIKTAMMTEAVKYFLRGKSMVVLVSPLLYESGKYTKWLKKTIVVHCSHEQQLKRLQSRDSLSEEEALRRIDSQMPLEEKCRRADIVVDNSKDKEFLRKQVMSLFQELNHLSLNQKMLRAYLLFLFVVVVIYLFIHLFIL